MKSTIYAIMHYDKLYTEVDSVYTRDWRASHQVTEFKSRSSYCYQGLWVKEVTLPFQVKDFLYCVEIFDGNAADGDTRKCSEFYQSMNDAKNDPMWKDAEKRVQDGDINDFNISDYVIESVHFYDAIYEINGFRAVIRRLRVVGRKERAIRYRPISEMVGLNKYVSKHGKFISPDSEDYKNIFHELMVKHLHVLRSKLDRIEGIALLDNDCYAVICVTSKCDLTNRDPSSVFPVKYYSVFMCDKTYKFDQHLNVGLHFKTFRDRIVCRSMAEIIEACKIIRKHRGPVYFSVYSNLCRHPDHNILFHRNKRNFG